MRIRTLTPTFRHTASTTGAFVAILGCAQVSQPGLASTSPTVSTEGFYHYATYSTRPMIEAHTVSFALDRIDQHDLPLDHTYRHQDTGRGVTVYVFDGGISDTHPELAGRVRRGYTAFPGDPLICNAHGTAVAGAIAGKTLGVAPDAQIVDVKMVQCEKLRGTIRGIVDGARWVILDHRAHPGPAVANWSFIADTAARIPALDSAVAALRAAGIPVVVSAGNVDINACRVSPGNAEGTIVVGASAVTREVEEDGRVRTVDRRADDTAWGPCVDLYAPGDSVLLPSLDRDQQPTMQLWNGTSMSAGYVSGAAALYLEDHPTASPNVVAAHLRHTATLNTVRDARSPFSRMLYVGPEGGPVQLKSVAQLRAEMRQ
ncbi:MAG TPA: S8 family peptidase [Acidobacteriaceae bacterium]|nr:S8 family peptidase [Acidobacteriaceae bacterium]